MAAQTQRPVSNHYLTQAGIAIALSRAVGAAWPGLDLQHLSDTLPDFRGRMIALVRQFALASASASARDYRRLRLESGNRSHFTVPLADPPPARVIADKINWAVSDLFDRTLIDGSRPEVEVQDVLQAVGTRVEGAVGKLSLDTGRRTTVDAVHQDRQARAWAREARPDCCYFCAMLAGRGAVYKTAQTAGDENGYHDHCHCVVVPVFGAYEMTAHARQWAADWDRLKSENGRVTLKDWRQHYEGRATT